MPATIRITTYTTCHCGCGAEVEGYQDVNLEDFEEFDVRNFAIDKLDLLDTDSDDFADAAEEWARDNGWVRIEDRDELERHGFVALAEIEHVEVPRDVKRAIREAGVTSFVHDLGDLFRELGA